MGERHWDLVIEIGTWLLIVALLARFVFIMVGVTVSLLTGRR